MSYRFLESLRHLNGGRIVVQRILIAPASLIGVDHQRRWYGSSKDDGKPFESVLGGPKVRSPFDNPDRVLGNAKNLAKSSTTEVNSKKEAPATETEVPDQVLSDLQAKIAEIEKLTGASAQKEVRAEPLAAAAAAPAAAAASDGGLWVKLNQKIGYNISDNLPEEEKKRLKLARNTFLGSVFVFGSLFVGFVWFCVHYGKAPRDAEGNVIKDEHSGTFLAPFYRILNSFKLWRDYVVEPSRDVLLPDPVPYPYLQPKYTLVIEMKNILVSPEWTYTTGYRFKKRPALDYFLDVVGYPNFEVVIYTSESSMTAASVVENMDPKQRVMYKLYRDCTKYMNGHHVKDLSKLNRDLKKVIYIDFDPQSFQLNPENVLRVPKWDGDMEDTALLDLAELLKTIHLSDVEDVRPTLQYYSQFDDPAKEFRRRAQYLAEQEHGHHEDQNSGLKKYAGKLFGFRRHNTA
uniref:Mitochondrial import inner membrane translocase subunit TIM50 n=1 Tax=Panagrellus redivivus TaxID=6233 RepID=A0A7E4V871_PANRE